MGNPQPQSGGQSFGDPNAPFQSDPSLVGGPSVLSGGAVDPMSDPFFMSAEATPGSWFDPANVAPQALSGQVPGTAPAAPDIAGAQSGDTGQQQQQRPSAAGGGPVQPQPQPGTGLENIIRQVGGGGQQQGPGWIAPQDGQGGPRRAQAGTLGGLGDIVNTIGRLLSGQPQTRGGGQTGQAAQPAAPAAAAAPAPAVPETPAISPAAPAPVGPQSGAGPVTAEPGATPAQAAPGAAPGTSATPETPAAPPAAPATSAGQTGAIGPTGPMEAPGVFGTTGPAATAAGGGAGGAAAPQQDPNIALTRFLGGNQPITAARAMPAPQATTPTGLTAPDQRMVQQSRLAGTDTAPTAGFSRVLAQERAPYARELDDPNVALQMATMLVFEHENDPIAVSESLMNRASLVGAPISRMLSPSFYGPMRNPARWNREKAALARQPQRVARLIQAAKTAAAGTNLIGGATDQGSGRDPNVGHRGGRVVRHGETYNDWGGARGGHAAAARRRMEQQQRVQQELRGGGQVASPQEGARATPIASGRGGPTATFNERFPATGQRGPRRNVPLPRTDPREQYREFERNAVDELNPDPQELMRGTRYNPEAREGTRGAPGEQFRAPYVQPDPRVRDPMPDYMEQNVLRKYREHRTENDLLDWLMRGMA